MLDQLRSHLRSSKSGFIRGCSISIFDLVVLVAVLFGGLIFHWNYHPKEQGDFILEGYPYCDGWLWWNGAIHFSEGLAKSIPGLGYFRPGYWILVGCLLAVIGASYTVFQKLLVVTFLATCMLFYLSLRNFLTKFGAFAGVALLVFNPDVAHWLSIGMTDAVGLILNLLALSCLFFATDRCLSIAWLSGFGLLFSASTLVRPIITPFIGAVILVILCMRGYPLKTRALAIIALVLTFWIPTLCIMEMQRKLYGEFTVSSNDASTFYAASEPTIQCWRSDMQEQVVSLARKRLHKGEADSVNINSEYWYQTRENYRNYLSYHLRRALPHLWEVASVQSSKASSRKGGDGRRAILIAVTLFSIFSRPSKNFGITMTLLLSVPLALWFIPAAADAMVCAGCVMAFIELRQRRDTGGLLIALYWLTGVLALYLTGGTIGPPITKSLTFSFLGQRLLLQVSFAGALLAVFFIERANRFWRSKSEPNRNGVYETAFGIFAEKNLNSPNRLAQKVVFSVLGCIFLSELLILLIGGCLVGYRYSNWAGLTKHNNVKPFPDSTAALGALQRPSLPVLLRTPAIPENYSSLLTSLQKDSKGNQGDSGDVIMLGTGSSFVWNLFPQNRVLVVCYQEAFYFPFSMAPNVLFCNVSRMSRPDEWFKKQGLFVLRNFSDTANDFATGQNGWGSPYHRTAPEVRAFIPLSPDGKSFDFDKARLFPLVKYATQLRFSGELKIKSGTMEQPDYKVVNSWRKSRTVTLRPDLSGSACLIIDSAKATGNRCLSFSYRYNIGNLSSSPVHGDLSATVTAKNRSGESTKELLRKIDSYGGGGGDRQSRTGNLDFSDSSIASLEIAFSGVPQGASIEMDELNLEADDFRN